MLDLAPHCLPAHHQNSAVLCISNMSTTSRAQLRKLNVPAVLFNDKDGRMPRLRASQPDLDRLLACTKASAVRPSVLAPADGMGPSNSSAHPIFILAIGPESPLAIVRPEVYRWVLRILR